MELSCPFSVVDRSIAWLAIFGSRLKIARSTRVAVLLFAGVFLRHTTGTAGVPVGSGGLTAFRLVAFTAERLRLVSV